MDRPVKLKRRTDGHEMILQVGTVEVVMTMGEWSQIVANPVSYSTPAPPALPLHPVR